jgi:hypothetical protein
MERNCGFYRDGALPDGSRDGNQEEEETSEDSVEMEARVQEVRMTCEMLLTATA